MRTMNIKCPVCNQTHPNQHVQITDAGVGTFICPTNGQKVELKNFMPGSTTMVLTPGTKSDSYGDATPLVTIGDISKFRERSISALSNVPDIGDTLNEAIYMGLGASFGVLTSPPGPAGDFAFTAGFTTPNQQVVPSNSTVAQTLPAAINFKLLFGDPKLTAAPFPRYITLNNVVTYLNPSYSHSSNVMVNQVPAGVTVRIYDPAGVLKATATNTGADGAALTITYPTSQPVDNNSGYAADQFGQPSGVDHVQVTFQLPGLSESTKTVQYYGTARSDADKTGIYAELDIQPQHITLNYYDANQKLVASSVYGGSQSVTSGKQYNLKIELVGQVLSASIWEANAVTPPIVLSINTGETVIRSVIAIYATHTNLLGAISSTSGWGNIPANFTASAYANPQTINWYAALLYPAIVAHATQAPLPVAATPATP